MKKLLLLVLSATVLFSFLSFDLTANAATILYGDVNSDGSVNVADSVLVSKYISNLADLTDAQFIAAEVSDDDVVNVADAVIIARYCAGLIDKFPSDKINGPIILPPIEF